MGEILTDILPCDARGQRQVDALLEREGIRRDRNLDYTCGLFDDGLRLVAAGSCYGNTLRCMAVDRSRQGEGLLNQVVSRLMEVQAQRGNTHVFLYTKCQSAKFFRDLGFFEIARADGAMVFMENRRRGFSDYLAALERGPGGTAAAVVMNANPFTLGHQRLAGRAAAAHDTLHLFILSEEAGPIPFAVRRRLVREGTAHLPNVILHDTGPYIISSATFPSYFLREGEEAIRAHAALDLAVFAKIAAALDIECRYAGEEPFSHMTSLYNEVMAQKLPESGVRFCTVPRLEVRGLPVSASGVRRAIHDGRLGDIRPFVPESTWDYFQSPQALPVIRAIQAETDVVHY